MTNPKALTLVYTLLKDFKAPLNNFTPREKRILEALGDCAEAFLQVRQELLTMKAKHEGSVNE